MYQIKPYPRNENFVARGYFWKYMKEISPEKAKGFVKTGQRVYAIRNENTEFYVGDEKTLEKELENGSLFGLSQTGNALDTSDFGHLSPEAKEKALQPLLELWPEISKDARVPESVTPEDFFFGMKNLLLFSKEGEWFFEPEHLFTDRILNVV